MAVSSQMVPLGTAAPDFALPDLSGSTVKLADFAAAPALLVIFACNHCPYVKHVESVLGALLAEYDTLAKVAISSNDWDSYPEDAPPKLAEQAERAGWTFPYLLDESQDVARAYQAACTPDFFLYDANRQLAYRGSLDGSTPGNGQPLTGDRLRTAIDLVLSGQPVPEPHIPSMGCSIKFRA